MAEPLKLLRKKADQSFEYADHVLGRAFVEAKRLFPCTCSTSRHADDCTQTRLQRLAGDVFTAAKRWGQLHERERIAEKTQARVGHLAAGRALVAFISRMRWPR